MIKPRSRPDQGQIKPLLVLHAKPAMTMPDAARVTRAIAACDFVAVSGLWPDIGTEPVGAGALAQWGLSAPAPKSERPQRAAPRAAPDLPICCRRMSG